MTTLSALCNKLEPTDELIMLNRHYQRLETICEKLDELVELISNLDDPDLTCQNNEVKMYAKKYVRLDVDKAMKQLQLLSDAAGHDHTLTAAKANEIFTFQKLGRAIFAYKQP